MRHIFVILVCLIHTFIFSVQWCYACLACFVPPIWLSLLLCIFAHLPICSCMSPCLLMSSHLIPTISCGFTPVFDTRDPESFIGILFDGTCVVHTPISWNYGYTVQTYICPPRTPILFDNMLVCPFVCLTYLFAPVWLSLLVCLFACSLYLIVIPFTCLLATLFVCCMYVLGARAQLLWREQQG